MSAGRYRSCIGRRVVLLIGVRSRPEDTYQRWRLADSRRLRWRDDDDDSGRPPSVVGSLPPFTFSA